MNWLPTLDVMMTHRVLKLTTRPRHQEASVIGSTRSRMLKTSGCASPSLVEQDYVVLVLSTASVSWLPRQPMYPGVR